jgi:hypothetical protein
MTPEREDPVLEPLLESDEQVRVRARATDATLAVTDRRVVVAADQRVPLAVTFDRLRRIQFDIERRRPATLVIVPEQADHEPQVLAVPPEEYGAVAEALVVIGHALASPEPG